MPSKEHRVLKPVEGRTFQHWAVKGPLHSWTLGTSRRDALLRGGREGDRPRKKGVGGMGYRNGSDTRQRCWLSWIRPKILVFLLEIQDFTDLSGPVRPIKGRGLILL